jgi:hypothetical protein
MGTRFTIIAILISSLLAACVATPAFVTAPPPDGAMPTAAVRAPTLASLQVTPAGMPAFSQANVTPSPTLQPVPTTLPTPIPPTMQPLGPGGLPHPLRVRRVAVRRSCPSILD